MLLTEDVFRMSDEFHAGLVNRSFCLSSAGRFGLIPSPRHFRVVIDIDKNALEVVALDCLALTKEGGLMDISYDSNYSGLGPSRVPISIPSEDRSYLLVVSLKNEWLDTGDGACEQGFEFCLIGENTPVPQEAIPIARIVEDMGWREDDQDFVPPCLLVAAHPKMISLYESFCEMLCSLERLVKERLITDSGIARRVFWPEVRRILITTDKERDTITPMSFLALVQECVSAFYCACMLDECLSLSDADKFDEYVRTPYNSRDVYAKIKEGLALSATICQKLEDFVAVPTLDNEKVQEPYIPESELHQFAVSNDVKVEVRGVMPGATCFYSTDGTEPSTPLKNERYVVLDPGFNKTRTKEQDRHYLVKLRAVTNGQAGRTVSVEVVVTKDVNIWKGYQI